jgi:hypothetical protein
MEAFIEQILSHPLLILFLSLVCILLLFAVLKGLVKLMLIACALGALYFGYLHFFAESYPLPEVDFSPLVEWKDRIEEVLPDDLNVSFSDRNETAVPE